jgi:formylglycine-generating enzyme required for sulfatase activity
MRYDVTNRQFADFVAASDYRSDAETRGAGWVWGRRWRLSEGADWRYPSGPRTGF